MTLFQLIQQEDGAAFAMKVLHWHLHVWMLNIQGQGTWARDNAAHYLSEETDGQGNIVDFVIPQEMSDDLAEIKRVYDDDKGTLPQKFEYAFRVYHVLSLAQHRAPTGAYAYTEAQLKAFLEMTN